MTKRLDIAIGSSYLVRLYWLMYLGVAILIASRYGLAWWQWLVFVLLCAWVVSILRVREHHVTAIVAPRYQELWQIQVLKNQQTQLWQGELLSIKNADICIVCEFKIIEPQPDTITVRIYPDQVSREDWRQLKSLVAFD